MRYTLAITSCNRHDLLERTLRSFVECTSHPPSETIILEDGNADKPAFLDQIFPRLGKLKWLKNGERRGQSYSIDRLYSELRDEYIFWCEDDWEFTEGHFLQPSKKILDENKDISMVALRSDWNHPLVKDPRGFEIAEPYWGGVWGGTCWNPGLRRLSDFKRFGSYGRHVGYGQHGLGHEKEWSKLHLDSGYRTACLPRHCHHIGGERSKAIEQLEQKLPKILIAIPACHEFKYGRWESLESPHYDPANEPYCKDIHISGANPRIDAVRETWWKDVTPFSHHVDAKFFYGSGANGGDEVNLGIPDDYAHLPHKTQAICRWALQRGYDYVAKFDDDTAVYVERLILELFQNPNLDYGGYLHGECCTGGPGYLLSRRAMQAIVEAGTPDFWAEDVWVSTVLARKNIYGTMLPGHTPGFAAHWYWPNGFDKSKLASDVVTMHAVQPEMMRTWYAERNNG
jgi:Glycosyl transferase family 2